MMIMIHGRGSKPDPGLILGILKSPSSLLPSFSSRRAEIQRLARPVPPPSRPAAQRSSGSLVPRFRRLVPPHFVPPSPRPATVPLNGAPPSRPSASHHFERGIILGPKTGNCVLKLHCLLLGTRVLIESLEPFVLLVAKVHEPEAVKLRSSSNI